MSKPVISLVCAMAKNRVIGKDNQMPWHLPADLKHFKSVTLGKPIVMGRKTYESIGRPLPGRRNIVISRNSDYQVEGCDTATSLESALALLEGVEEVMVIGGGRIYSQALAMADKLFLTFIDLDIEGDTHFPEFEHLALNEVKREIHEPDEKNLYRCEFVDFEIG
ncbi:type 3 dihydrofolate reductase [Aliikangiella coralliicola]|uniref:Dihydrofolate reductase n=1 Tax=Aliikangiella coralliicola TaxID=2592383 RepID=A0A545UI64_9GAMM|nr:type 3 dihydrofolate reductase [Aliikangiella coralliicola]TQV89123.1 type 3 dihydrofolate reductase [Aliikangiella coralliicola]